MSVKQYLNTILKPIEDKLFRGFNLGDSLEEVIKAEGEGYEHDDTFIPFYRYYFPIAEDKTFQYKMVYYAEGGPFLGQITMDAIFGSDQDNDLTQEEFQQLFEELYRSLEDKYGSAKVETVKQGKDKEIYHEWIIKIDADNSASISLVRYQDSRSDVKDAIKLDIQYYYE